MITQLLHCPFCNGIDIVSHGKTPQGKQRAISAASRFEW